MIKPSPELDKAHPLLKYVLGTKGTSRTRKGWVCTCTCKSYAIVPTEDEAIEWYGHHEDCHEA